MGDTADTTQWSGGETRQQGRRFLLGETQLSHRDGEHKTLKTDKLVNRKKILEILYNADKTPSKHNRLLLSYRRLRPALAGEAALQQQQVLSGGGRTRIQTRSCPGLPSLTPLSAYLVVKNITDILDIFTEILFQLKPQNI